ncbi:uncharacterized protein LOC122850499 [Aphidius gifuensis]|uniref:uncharacterized protein LOC122850499 n=1 Tax=Aphidius gifuensis TaxID=684658 RepID=UPI001CDCD563|nr:uncharacterized protein LOC122850499 [Aphidius gifuensis]
MTSFGANRKKESGYQTTFKIQGQIYHRIGSLVLYDGDESAFLQIYFIGDDQIESEQNMPTDECKIVLRADKIPSNEHERRFNLPVVQEVAAIINGNEFIKRDIILQKQWQKRGLPHVHILVWLKNKIHANQINDIISAELPDPEQDPLLHEIIKKNMIHGPCRPLNPFSPCMKNGKCSYNYPRALIDATRSDRNGYPLYRRRSVVNGGFQTTINAKIHDKYEKINIDNRWIVLYCPLISKIMEAHVNVELCSSVVAVQYILKYIHKGSDQAIFTIENKNDEIEKYQSGRYISSNEAIW